MQFSQQQLDQAAKAQLFEKLDRGFCASVPNASLLDRATRFEFFEAAMTEATALGLRTEQGIASYALAAWYLEPGFVDQSRYLRALLASDYPEVRKVHAMNEVHVHPPLPVQRVVLAA